MRKIFGPKPIAVISVFTMLIVLIGGALVTKTDSGLGCGRTWPLCKGQLIPTNVDLDLIFEYSHRIFSGLAIIFVLVLSWYAWKRYNHVKETRPLVIITIVFFIIQSLLGALAVIIDQNNLIKALHFGISLISFATVFLLALIIFDVDKKFNTARLTIPKKLRVQYYSLFVFTLIVVYTGALVRHMRASLVCRDWPFCFNGSPFAFSDYSLEQWVHMGHRLFAGILLVWVVGLLIHIRKHYKHEAVIYKSWVINTWFIVIQVLLGALILVTKLNMFISLAHALFISLFFAVLCYLLILARRSAIKEK